MTGEHVSRSVPVKSTGTGYGAAVDVGDIQDQTLQVSGTWTGTTVQVFGSLDGTNFAKIGSDLTADAWVALAPRLKAIKINTSVAGSAFPSAVIAGTQAARG